MFGQDVPGQVGNSAFIGKGEFPGEFPDGYPSYVHGFMVGIVFNGEVPAGGTQQVVVNSLVDPVPADGEPVIDAAQRGQDVALDAGFLGNFADGCLFVVFLALRMTLREAPLEPPAPVNAGDDRNP